MTTVEEINREARDLWRHVVTDMVNDQRVCDVNQCIEWANEITKAYLNNALNDHRTTHP